MKTLTNTANSGLEYIKIPAGVFALQDLSLSQKILLGLVMSMRLGLKISNSGIGKLLMLRPDSISKLISDLELKKYIRITGAQSKYRIIYFGENPKVKTILLTQLD